MNKKRLVASAALIALVGSVGAADWLINFSAEKEGLRTKPYRDAVGVLTVCYGHTSASGAPVENREYTPQECEKLLNDDLVLNGSPLAQCFRDWESIPPNIRAAIVDTSLNVGPDWMCNYSVSGAANAGDLPGACRNILKYIKAGGKVLQGLVNRRADAYRKCMEGEPL
jgi:lysozyme